MFRREKKLTFQQPDEEEIWASATNSTWVLVNSLELFMEDYHVFLFLSVQKEQGSGRGENPWKMFLPGCRASYTLPRISQEEL